MNERQELVLVIDDEENNRDLLARHLKRKGYAVVTACDAGEGLKLVKSRPIDLVLLDHMMPKVSGLEALKLLRHKYSASLLPVIMVTARDDDATMVEAMELGANDYITKPVEFAVLFARMESQLSRKRAEEALAEARALVKSR